MSTMTTTTFYSVKSGACTTVALGYAKALAVTTGDMVTVSGNDTDELLAFAGVPTTVSDPFGTPLAENVELIANIDGMVFDAGKVEKGTYLPVEGRKILVLRGPDYSGVRRALEHHIAPDGVVIVREEGRSITADDVEAVLGVPVLATINVDPAIARAVDAGLFMGRTPKAISRLARI